MKFVFLLQLLPPEFVSFQDYWVEVSKRTTQKDSNVRVTTGIRIRDSIFLYIVYSLISYLQMKLRNKYYNNFDFSLIKSQSFMFVLFICGCSTLSVAQVTQDG